MTPCPRRTRIGALALTVVCVWPALLGCGSGAGRTVDGPPLSPLSSAPPPPGAPVTVMIWAPRDTTSALAYPDLPVVAQAFADLANSQGGVNGRPLVVISCDERGEAASAVQCARQAVRERVLAVVGSVSFHAGEQLPILQAAGIPYLGGLALTGAELTSPISFPIAGGLPLQVTGAARMAATQGCQRTAMVRQDSVTTPDLERFATAGLAADGRSLASTTVLSSTAGALAPQVAPATRDSDCVLVVSGDEQETQRFLAAYQQLGASQRLFTIGIGNSARVAALFPEISARTYLADILPPAGNGVWRRYRDALAASPAAASVDVDLDGTAQRRTWASFEVFLQVARELTVFSSSSMLDTLRGSATVDTGGLVPGLNFTRDNPLPGLDRLFNPTVTYQKFEDGRFTELRPGFQDMTPALAAAAGR